MHTTDSDTARLVGPAECFGLDHVEMVTMKGGWHLVDCRASLVAHPQSVLVACILLKKNGFADLVEQTAQGFVGTLVSDPIRTVLVVHGRLGLTAA